MDRLQKKCLIASLGTHGLLLLIVMFGSAFFIAKKSLVNVPAIRVVPGKLVDTALSGGGGTPTVPPSEDKVKGETLMPQPEQPPTPPKPVPTPPKPQQPAAEPKRLTLVPKVRNTPKPATETATPKLKLTPVDSSKNNAKPDNRDSKARNEIADKIGEKVANLRSGFEQGTAVQVNGPGGEAFVDYAQWVKQVYQDAWIVTDELDDEQATAKVSVTIARDGRVTASEMTRKSGNTVLDKSVERTLLRVRMIRPFPEGAKDSERTFIINFNLKAKRGIG